MEQVAMRPRRRRWRPLASLCILSPIVLCLGWSALWLFAEHEAGQLMDGWMAQEAGHGRRWSCPDRRIDGYPFELRVSCTKPTLHGTVGGETVDVAVAGMTAHAWLYQPTAIAALVTSPARVETTALHAPALLSWSSLTIDARVFANAPGRLAILLDNAALDDADATGKARHIEIHLTPVTSDTGKDGAYDIALNLIDGDVPALAAITKETAALSMDVRARLTNMVPPSGEPWQLQVERWRLGGGVCDVSSWSVTKGNLKAAIEGRMGLDPQHRLSGRLKVGMSASLLSLGLDRLAASGSVPFGLTLLLKTQLTSAAGETSLTKLPIILADGRISVGPVPTPQRLTPFY